MLSARHFLWVPAAWPGRRSETETAWQPQQPPKGSREDSSGRRSGQGRMRRGAVQCSRRAGGAVRFRVDPRLCCRSCAVLFCLRGARTTAGNTGRRRVQRTAAARPGGQAAEDSDMRAAGGALAVVAGAMAEILGAGGRSSRWCRAGWPGIWMQVFACTCAGRLRGMGMTLRATSNKQQAATKRLWERATLEQRRTH
jgi:hypothetical protein